MATKEMTDPKTGVTLTVNNVSYGSVFEGQDRRGVG